MSGLKNTWRRIGGFLTGQGYKTSKEKSAQDAAQRQSERDEMFASATRIPDDEVLKRNARRKAAKRQGSRANTVLTNSDQLGPG